MNTVKEVETLIRTLRFHAHVVEFADKCAERAVGYFAYYARHAARAARHAAYCTYAAADAAYASHASHASTGLDELELQIAHLKKLHAREGS